MRYIKSFILNALLCLPLACGPSNTEGNNSFRITLANETVSLKAGSTAFVMYSVISDSPEVSVSVLPVDGIEASVKPSSGDGKMGDIALKALPGSEGRKNLTIVATDGNNSSRASLIVEIEKTLAKRLKSIEDEENVMKWNFEYDNQGKLIRVLEGLDGDYYSATSISYTDNSIMLVTQTIEEDENDVENLCQSIFALSNGRVVSGVISAGKQESMLSWKYDDQGHVISMQGQTIGRDDSWTDKYVWSGNDFVSVSFSISWMDNIAIQYGDQIDYAGISCYLLLGSTGYFSDGFIDLLFLRIITDGVCPPSSQHLPLTFDGTTMVYEYDSDGYPISMRYNDYPHRHYFTYYE